MNDRSNILNILYYINILYWGLQLSFFRQAEWAWVEAGCEKGKRLLKSQLGRKCRDGDQCFDKLENKHVNGQAALNILKTYIIIYDTVVHWNKEFNMMIFCFCLPWFANCPVLLFIVRSLWLSWIEGSII